MKELPEDIDIITLEDHDYPLVSKKPFNNKIVGYIQVDEDDYIAVIRPSFLPIILLFIILIGILVGYLYHKNVVDIPIIADTVSKVSDKNPQAASETIEFAGFGSEYTFSQGDKFYLSNPDGNSVYDMFIITDANSGEELYRSQLVPSGKAIELDPYSVFDAGATTVVNIHVTTYDQAPYDKNQTLDECTPMNYSNVSLTLE